MGDMVGTRVEVEITGVAHGGIFVARHEGRVIFVSDAIPGEKVVAQITDDAKTSFWRADTVAVLEPSPHRRDHVWPEAALERAPADRAGGAEFGHITLSHQRALKAQVLTESLSRMAKIDRDAIVEALPSGDSAPDDAATAPADETGTGWRTRVRLQVGPDGTAGPYSARSHRVIRTKSLPLAVREAQSIAPLAEKLLGTSHVDIVIPSTGNPFVLAGEADSKARGHRIVERVGDREFRLDVLGFWQVHRHAPATLTAAVQSAIDEALFDPRAANLDLYGGVGLLAAAVGDRFGQATRITSVESDRAATEFAGHNLRDWAGAETVTARVERFLGQVRQTASASDRARYKAATIVLDPPRSGAGKQVVGELAALQPAQLVYVACDPVALSRDVALFAERGYRLAGLRAFDLFPNTHHVEAVATLVRAD